MALEIFVREICQAIKCFNATDTFLYYREGRIPLDVKKFVCYKHSRSIEEFDLWAKRYCGLPLGTFSQMLKKGI